MLKNPFLVICAFTLIILGDSSPRKRKREFEEVDSFNGRLGIHIASDTFIQQYENEHRMMYRNEYGTADEAEYLEWPQKLGDKNLTQYCERYLNAITPKRHMCNMFGEVQRVRLIYHYVGDFIKLIGAVRCKIPFSESSKSGKSYYITESPDLECVYTLMRRRSAQIPFRIVSKVCGFESNDTPNFIYQNIRPKDRKRTVSKIHKRTGIPIAKRDLIEEYEYRHREMYKMDDGSPDIERYIAWPLNRNNTYLSNLCSMYLKAVIPNRVTNCGLSGKMEQFVLQYTQNNWGSMKIGMIKCKRSPPKELYTEPLYYYITESPEPNCLYTLLRSSSSQSCSIVYQICDFRNDKHVIGDNNLANPPVDGTNKGEKKPDITNLENIYLTNPFDDSTEEWKMKSQVKTIRLWPNDHMDE